MSDPQQTLSYESPPMTRDGIGIGTIALQLVGVYCFVLGLPMLAMMATWAGVTGQAYVSLLGAFIPLAAYVVMGVLLIRFAPRISLWLFRDNVARVMAGSVTAGSGAYIQAIAFSVVGVLLMANAAPTIISLIWTALMDRGLRFEGYGLFVEPVMRFLLGLALFLQSKGLALLWHKIRTGGVIAPAPASVSAPIPSDSDNA
jgi:hypothetical protein